MHGTEAPSPWVQRWSHLVPEGAGVLDVACGAGRHLRWFAAQGHAVTGVDRDPQALALARELGALDVPVQAQSSGDGWELVQADIENGPWPFSGRRFGAVVVTNYLWRDLLPTLVDSVAPGGVLIYETFALGQGSIGKPSRPDFLLRPGELLTACGQELRVVAYEDGFLPDPARFVQRIAAVRPAPSHAGPPRHRLS